VDGVEDTWASRDLPVLDAVVSMKEEDMFLIPTVAGIAERCGLDVMDVGRAVKALDGTYLDLQMLISGGDPSPWFVQSVYPSARFAVGQWPTGDVLVERLVQGLDEAAEAESDPERRSRLKNAAAWIGGGLRDVAANALGTAIAKSTGMG
jgi:hypothetical protein